MVRGVVNLHFDLLQPLQAVLHSDRMDRICIYCQQEKPIMFNRTYYYECFGCIKGNALKNVIKGGKRHV